MKASKAMNGSQSESGSIRAAEAPAMPSGPSSPAGRSSPAKPSNPSRPKKPKKPGKPKKPSKSAKRGKPDKAASLAQSAGESIRETLAIFAHALILAFFARSLFFQPFTIPSGSMMPTLLTGDYIFVSKYTYGYSRYSFPGGYEAFEGRIWDEEPERGDVIVFKLPDGSGIDYIKRLIGLPGDTVQMIEGALYLNGERVQRENAGEWGMDGGFLRFVLWKETLPNGVSYNTVDIVDGGPGDNTELFTVPEGHYFLMGDNRDNSLDSRFEVGFVPYENLIGPARAIFFSVGGGSHPLTFWNWPVDLRLDRFMEGI